MIRLAAVVVTYNRKQLLKQNLDSLALQTVGDFDVIVIDNASTDGTEAFISDTVSKMGINYIKLPENVGGAGGFNFGVKTAVQNGYDRIWIMDDDTLPTPDALQMLLKADKQLNGNYGFLSSVALWTDGALCKMNKQKLIPMSSYEKRLREYNLDRTNYATFVSFFIKADTVRDIGLPIKDFFIWGDDIEYAGRIAEKYRCYVVKDSIVVHKTASNVGSNIATDGADRISRYAYAYRNEMYIARKNGIFGVLRQCAKITVHLFRVLFKSKGDRLKKWRIILENSHKGIYFNPSVERVD